MVELQLWERADNYLGADLSDYYVIYGQHRDSPYITKSNMEVALKRLGGEKEPNVIIARFGHWAVGWVEQLLVHKNASQEILDIAYGIVNDIEEYPILDECHYDELISGPQNDMYNEIKKDLQESKEDGEERCRYWNLPVDADDEEIWECVYDSIV